MDCGFISYAHTSSAYRFLVHKSEIPNIHENTVIKSRNVSFFENTIPYKDAQESNSLKRTLDGNMGQRSIEADNEDEPRYSKRARTSTSFGPNFLNFLLESKPQNFKKTMSCSEVPQ